jgi:hypothetical protein
LSWIVPFKISYSSDAAAREEQSSGNQRILHRQYCKGLFLGYLPEVWERKIWNFWPPSSSICNPLDYFMLGVFLLHVTLTPENTGDFLKQKTIELENSLDRDTMA